jgi:ATP-dependent DNA helicase RecG
MAILQKKISGHEVKKILCLDEGHFVDAKSKRIKPSDLTKTMSAFANADGGEIYIGLEDGKPGMSWDGFLNAEEANGHIQVFEELFPFGDYFTFEFIQSDSENGLLLKCEISKTPDLRPASNGKIYLRRGAQNLSQSSEQQIRRIEYNKGLFSFEDERLDDDLDSISQSATFAKLADEIVPKSDPILWLKKQRLILRDRPTVASEILFNDEPQAVLPKSAIKIYRYKTDKSEGSRDVLDFNPVTIEGSAYDLIERAVDKTI